MKNKKKTGKYQEYRKGRGERRRNYERNKVGSGEKMGN